MAHYRARWRRRGRGVDQEPPLTPLNRLSRRPYDPTPRHSGRRLCPMCPAMGLTGDRTIRAAAPASGKPQAPHDGGESPVSTRVDQPRRGRSRGRHWPYRPPAVVDGAHSPPCGIRHRSAGGGRARGGHARPNRPSGRGGNQRRKSNDSRPTCRGLKLILNHKIE